MKYLVQIVLIQLAVLNGFSQTNWKTIELKDSVKQLFESSYAFNHQDSIKENVIIDKSKASYTSFNLNRFNKDGFQYYNVDYNKDSITDVSKTIYTYYKQNKLLNEVTKHISELDSQKYIINYFYNESNQLEKEVKFYKTKYNNDSLDFTRYYKYHKNGKLNLEEQISSNIETQFSCIYKYDNSGNLIYTKKYSNINFQPVEITETTFTYLNNKISKQTTANQTIIYKYNNGILKEELTYELNDSLHPYNRLTYNKNGLLADYEKLDPNGNVTYYRKNKYNSKNNIEEEISSDVFEYYYITKYIFDSKDNWIKKITSHKDGSLNYLIERAFEYY